MDAAGKRKPAWGDLAVALAILAAAAALAFALAPRPAPGLYVQVTLAGETVLFQSLSGLSQPIQMAVEGRYPLTLELSREGVRVMEAACPGEDCRHMGTISAAGERIICLPNRMMAALLGEQPSYYDAITG